MDGAMSVNRRRLVCPSCGAKYEVDASLIPPAGRDVQCSNCGRTWFEPFDEPEAAKPAEPVEPAAPVAAPSPVAEPPPVVAPKRAAPTPPPPPVQFDLPPEPEDDDEPPIEPGKEIEFPTPPHIAESVREMLKTEAEREASARADEHGGDNWGKRRTSPLRDKMTQARATDGAMPEDTAMANAVAGLAPPAPPADMAKAAPRRDRLPDVEEINSSLQASQDRYTDGLLSPEELGQTRRGGFRSGFFFMIVLAVLAVVIYALADLIADQVPQMKAPLDAYVAWVDALRVKLDETVRGWMGQGASGA
jgi:predicted Zn finger-like uncharacterized protein